MIQSVSRWRWQAAALSTSFDADANADKWAVEEFYKRHVCRIYPFPKDLVDTMANVEEDDVRPCSLST
jgi:hypothetical protein